MQQGRSRGDTWAVAMQVQQAEGPEQVRHCLAMGKAVIDKLAIALFLGDGK
jgi:hypothetical protein